MSSNSAKHLVVPGLLGHLPRLGELGDLPRFPNLELLLSCARSEAAPVGYPETLFTLFGLPLHDGVDVPTASLCYHAEASIEPLPDTYLLHADPVHLRPDQDRLLAFDFHHQPLSPDEARQYAEAFNAHFADDGLRLLTPHPARWYLAVSHQPKLRTRPLAEILGRNIDLYLPEGDDAQQWRGWMNELQMLFYTLPINQTRQTQGELPVSGLWFSGGGVLPTQTLSGFEQVSGACGLFDALQKQSELQPERSIHLEHAPGRAVLDASASSWLEALERFDQALATMMREPLDLYPCDGTCWLWRPAWHGYFWKPRRRLKHWLGE